MKRFLHPSLFVLVAILLSASMCEDDDKNSDRSSNKVESTLGQGTWQVFYFFDKTDETSDFAGYTFLFNDKNVAIASKNSLSVQGSWETENSSDGDTKLYLDFGTNSSLDELNEDWVVIDVSSLKITLEHVSGGNGDTDTLILERKL